MTHADDSEYDSDHDDWDDVDDDFDHDDHNEFDDKNDCAHFEQV